MSREEFKNYIKSIGFEYNDAIVYDYKKYRIDLYQYIYDFYNGSEWVYDIDLNDLTLLEKYFKKELRSIKLKQLLR